MARIRSASASRSSNFIAALAAGEEDTETLQSVCDKAGITILRRPGQYDPTASLETIAASAERGPIKSDHIKAVEYLMTHPDYRDGFRPQDLTAAIVDLLTAAEEESDQLAMSKRLSLRKALATVRYRKCKKRRHVSRQAA